jgi:diguanylate cyclase (GGDEF)-like protein/PAS domain S-box-containing protein
MLSLTASLFYFLVGLNVIRLYRKSKVCKIFFILTLSLAIWSLPGAFVYLAENPQEYALWNKISALGWCTFEAIGLYFVMTLTENKLMRHWYVKLLILLPAVIFLYMVLFLFGPDITTSPIVESVFYKGNFLYNFIYPLMSILLILRWGMRSKSRLQKKQAYIISISSFISFLLILIIQTILPAMGLLEIPSLGQVYSLIMMYGVYYSIHRYQFMSIPTSLITNELFKELTGLAFLLDSQGFIIKTNRQLYHLLNYMEDEVLGKHITEIIKHSDIDKIMDNSETFHTTLRLEEIPIPSKTGMTIPFKISIIPLKIKSGFQLGLLILGEDIRVIMNQKQTEAILKQNNENINKLNDELLEMNQRLIQKSNRDSLTNLYNHQYINTILEDLLLLVRKEAADICVMMLDIDYFKQVNDGFGHLTGDRVLVTISDIIRKCIRANDYIGRYGGEEFLVVMPNIRLEAAALISEKIRRSIETHNFEIKGLTVTISIGLAQYAGETSKDLVNKADKLLYQAKTKGRNRYELELE